MQTAGLSEITNHFGILQVPSPIKVKPLPLPALQAASGAMTPPTTELWHGLRALQAQQQQQAGLDFRVVMAGYTKKFHHSKKSKPTVTEHQNHARVAVLFTYFDIQFLEFVEFNRWMSHPWRGNTHL